MKVFITLGPGIKEPLCGYQWLWDHKDDPYPPVQFELITPTCRHTVTIKTDQAMKEVVKEILKGE